ncbi:uncharacterized protein LOC110997168 isoform X2 [Pieris rapae]|uniref:uncharacterized protein LOC110997168 isoform X2 n=1 Tax=Pieris rapae TaxID=64459 RepID=UPI001E27A76E|nr:uncharacterized protein LOC110997168 isoform X2 [Pieris rapae]
MSDGDVSLIRDEDVLRRMWQQTEDFSRKKEIRAHMYRLREERLRNLYSPEPSLDAAKDLKDLSNAGWNVESENRTTDDGHTRVKSVNANIEGRYDVDGGKGHFAAADHHKQAVTEYSDGNTNLKRNEDYSNTSAHEQVERQTGDGTHITSTSSSSTSASKFEQTSSTYESVPYQAYDNCDPRPQPFDDNNINEEFTMKETTNIRNHNQTLSNDYEHGELMSRKIDYPDDNTKVIVETRCLPDGTKVTSTRREFRAPSAQTIRSEHHSEQIKSESKSTSCISSQKKTQSNESSTKLIHDKSYNTNVQDIVDSQRNKDDLDFKNNDITDYADSSTRVIRNEKVTESANNEEQSEFTKFYDSKSVRNHDALEKTIYDRKDYKKDTYVEDVNKSHERKQNDYYISDDNKNTYNKNVQKQEDVHFIHKDSSLEDPSKPAYKSEDRRPNETAADSVMNHKKIQEDSQILKTSGEYVHKISKDCNVKENTETRSTHQYQTTYQTDYTHRKISTDLSPTHQAWASTLRSDTPPRSTARAPSPGNKTYKSSTSSLRSSVSPDKIYRKSSSRSVSPNKIGRFSPTKPPNDQTFSSTQLSSSILETKSNYTTDIIDKHVPKNKSPTRQLHSPERKSNSDEEKRSSVTPDKQSKTPRYLSNTRRSTSPIRNSESQPVGNRESPSHRIPSRSTPSPVRHYQTSPREEKYSKHEVIDRQDTCTTSTSEYSEKVVRDETIIGGKTNITEQADNQPSYMRQTVSSKSNRSSSPTKQPYSDRKSPIKQLPSQSPDRQLYNVNKENERFIKEESKINTSCSEYITNNSENNTQSLSTSPDRDYKKNAQPLNDYDKISRTSISPNKDLVLSEVNNTQTENLEKSHQHFTTSVSPKQDIVNRHEGKEKKSGSNKQPSRESSPVKRHESPVRIISKSNKEIPGYMQEPRVKDNENKNRSPSPIAKDTSISSNLLQKNENFKEVVYTTDGNDKVFHSFDKNIQTKSTTPLKESPRRSPSPKKRTSDTKNNQTHDFIQTEIFNEEINKIAAKKSRTLHTPSTSPSRIPKSDETAPSRGQSSPTTNSGFIHLNTEIESSATISKESIKRVSNDASKKEHDRTPSPTKIPCRSPSPEKVINKENLPRKSSLKKPSFDNGNVISLPKPPTTFLISPENEKSNDNEKEEVPKDKPKSDKPVKIKPPLERRETYEERCRKILGMSDDNSTKETNTTHAKSGDIISPKTSPSISPCESPVQIEEKGFSDDNYGLVNIVDLTSKSSVPLPLKTETYKSDIQISTEASWQKTAVESVIDHCQTLVNMPFKQITASNETTSLQDTMPNKIPPQNSSLPFSKPQESKTLTDNDSENGLNKTKYDKVHESTPLKPSNVSEEVKLKETISECITSQQEQDILDRVQSSLRKLSPDRKGKPVEDNSHKKNNSKLPILHDKTTKDESINQDSKEINNTAIVYSEDKLSDRKKTLVTEKFVTSKNQIPSKPSSRNTSPVKKPLSPQNLTKTTTETVKPRSTSPKKPMSPIEKKHVSPIERPQSPQLSKTTFINTKDQRTSSSSTLKTERTDLKKTTKSQSTRRTSPTKFNATKTAAVNNNKSQDNENKTPQKLNHSPTLKKEIDSKVIRTSSDINMKSPLKKVSPQRMKSKPEIQLNNVATNKIYKQNTHSIATKTHKSLIKQATTKLPVSKPKSATALNSSIDDDDDIIIDVQQAKSSRENSPDRICPTPVGFSEDTGTPRFPDEVNEPDDEINKRSHNIIHEAESIVDDIVEICEEDELFVRAEESEMQKLQQKSLVSDKSTKLHTVQSKEMDSIISNKNQGHRDLIKGNLISDESLLSVSEKVNRFAKGPVISKDRSPSRNIKEEYDRDTIYTDDYTKLSVNDKAHLFIETAENVKTMKPKSIQKPVRPDFSNIDESLKSDECLLSVSDKVNKFVKSAVDVSKDANAIEEKEKKIQEVHDNIMKRIIDDVEENLPEIENISVPSKDYNSIAEDNKKPRAVRTSDDNFTKSTTGSNKLKPDRKQSEQLGSVKITTLRSSEAVKKAKALFENIASTTKPKERTVPNRTTKLTDIGVSQKIPTTKTTQLTQDPRPTIQQTDYDEENTELSSCNRQKSPNKNQLPSSDIKKDNLPINRAISPLRRDKSPSFRSNSPHKNDKTLIEREKSPLPKSPRDKSPMARTKSPILREVSPISNVRSPIPQTATIVPKKVLSRLPETEQVDSTTKQLTVENKKEKSLDKLPGYQRPTKTSQMKEEKYVEEIEVSSRRGSGKFGVELRRASADRSSVSSERRRCSVEHHQPCIEDIFDLDLLEQMLEKVVGYEQRRRIRAQIRVAKKKIETEDTAKVIRNLRQSTTKVIKTKSPERLAQRSPDRLPISKKVSQNVSAPNRISSPERQHPKSIQVKSVSSDCQQQLTTTAGIYNEQEKTQLPLSHDHDKQINKTSKVVRAQSPEKHMRTAPKTVHQSSSDKRRPVSPSKLTSKTKGNRFSEYASAYMKKVGLPETDKLKHKVQEINESETKKMETNRIIDIHNVKTTIDRTSSKDIIEIQIEGKKSPSPNRSFDRNIVQQPRIQSAEKEAFETPSEPSRQNSERQPSPNRSPSPETKRTLKKDIKSTTIGIEKKVAQKQVHEEKPSWVTSRNLKKVTTESRTFSSKKIETDKPKYRPSSPSKAITKPIDVITSSYGPGPLDADGKPLFGIKALRNGAANYQVKGTVIRQEFHSRNGSEPEGTVSVTAYSTEPEDLEKLLQTQGEKPSRLHGLAAITTTKKFGGDTGTTFREVATKEERAALEQFTHSDRRTTESQIDTHTDSLQRTDQREKIEIASNKTQNQKRSHQMVQSSLKKETKKDFDQKETRSDSMQRAERRVEDRKTVRQNSVKSLTEKFIKNASETTKTERQVYPKAGLILRTAGIKDSVSSDSSAHAGLARTDSEHSLASVEDMMTTTTTTTEQLGDILRTTTTVTKTGGHTQERSFLDSSTKVTGVQDILTRMKNADIVIEEGDSNEDSEARALLNKFLGATVLMAGMQNYVTESAPSKQERSKGGVDKFGGRQREDVDIEQCWDERVLRKLLDECTDYELRRRLRTRIRALMAEQEACASAVTEALAAAGETVESAETEEHQQAGERGESLLLPLLQGLLQGGGEKLLAGLGTASHDVVADVRRSLQRLRLALAPPADHPQARALLALADRLEDALDVADRLDGCKRKPRRRSRTARHTVGVTREELEEARRMVDRDTLLPDVKPVTSTVPSNTSSVESCTPERKQSVDEDISYFEPVETKQKLPTIAHSVSYESGPKVKRDAQVVERRFSAPRRADFFRHSIADSVASETPRIAAERWKLESKGGIAAIANKFDAKIEKENLSLSRRTPTSKPQITLQHKAVEEARRSNYRPPPPTYNFAAPQSDDQSKPLNRSSNAAKRLRMKRANTIDIGRPLGGYKFDSATHNDTNVSYAPPVPEFQPETENDKKFLAFMQKNEENVRNHGIVQANWSSRFGNIKNAFESREKEEHSRSSSASSAKRFWQVADSTNNTIRPRKFLPSNEAVPDIVKPPWVSQRRESLKSHILPIAKQVPQQTVQPPSLLSPTKPSNIKPFVAKPLPVNQFSHAPMSAFKPPQKVLSPTRAPPNIWSPPSCSIPISPSAENPLKFPSTPPSYNSPTFAGSAYLSSDAEKQRQVTGMTTMYENNKFNHVSNLKSYEYPATPPTHAQHNHNYPIKAIPSQNSLTAPELVKKINNNGHQCSDDHSPKIDAQQLQIEFYERQILEKSKRDASSERHDIPLHKPPVLSAIPSTTPYTIVDYTPLNSASSFVPLQQTPDIEKAKAHKVDYLPDVVINENNSTNYLSSPLTHITSISPTKHKQQTCHHNGDVVVGRVNGEDTATEHESVETKVMRGPVRGSATITTGVRTRGAADNLRGVLNKLSSPKHEVISQIERKKRENSHNQVRLAAPPRPVLSPSHATSPTRPHANEGYGSRSPALAASRESVLSSESPASRGSSPGSALTRSGSWHRLSEYNVKTTSPRKVVARTKSMHLLAVPKLYEGGISQDEFLDKKRTVEAYFSGQTSPSRGQQKTTRTSTAQFALGRSRTMPVVSELQFLDESNADDAFEDLVSGLA